MHGNQDVVNMWSPPQMTSTENGSPDIYQDPCDDYIQDEDGMETEEIEAMLYSQLYFEPHDADEAMQLVAPTDYNINIEEQATDKFENKNSLAAMVNFSGRSYMSPSGVTPERNETKTQPVVKEKSKTNEKATSAKNTSSEVDNQRNKKKGKSKEVVLVLSDSSFNDEEEMKAMKKTGKGSAKFASKRRADKIDLIPVKKLKTNQNDVVIVDSSSDSHTDSESDDCVFDKLSDSDDDININLNLNGLWRNFRNPVRSKPPDLRTINLQTWDGDPPLTVEEVHKLLKGSCWKIDDDDRYGLMRIYGQKRMTCKNCNEKGHHARECSKPKKIPKCAMCGEEGHMHWRCPNGLCYNCDLPGHSSKSCTAPRKSYRVVCNRCGFPGHIQNACPEHWRQYHLTTKPGPLQVSDQKENEAVFCYNCGKKGHYGYECGEEKINEYLQPWSPFVTCYSKPKEHKQKKVKVKKHKKKVSKKKTEKPDNKSVSPTLKGQGKTWTPKEWKTKNTSIQEKKEKKKNKIEWPSVPQFLKNPLEKLNSKHKKKKSNQTKKKAFDEELDCFQRNKSYPENTNKKDNADKTDKCNQDLNKFSKTRRKKMKQSVFGCAQQNSNKVGNKHCVEHQQCAKPEKKKKRTEDCVPTIFDSPLESPGKAAKKHCVKDQQCAKPVEKRIDKCVHTIFDSPYVSPGKTSKNQSKKNKTKDDRNVKINERGFRMTIYN